MLFMAMTGREYAQWLMQQADRRDEIKALYRPKQGKGKTQAEIGRMFGITRERVRQIIESA